MNFTQEEIKNLQPLHLLYAMQQVGLYVTEQVQPNLQFNTCQQFLESMWTYSTEELFGLSVERLLNSEFLLEGEYIQRSMNMEYNTCNYPFNDRERSVEKFYIDGVREIVHFIERNIRRGYVDRLNVCTVFSRFVDAVAIARGYPKTRETQELMYNEIDHNLREIFWRAIQEGQESLQGI